MTKPISRSIFDAYFHVAEGMGKYWYMTHSKRYFHRTKKVAFSVMAERIGKNGYLPDAFGYLPGERAKGRKRS